jgi:hypothetical protein
MPVTRYHPGGVAPFGYPRIIACPRLPEAFRGLATSFIGSRCQGIHRVPFARIRLRVTSTSAPAQRSELIRSVVCTPTHLPEEPLHVAMKLLLAGSHLPAHAAARSIHSEQSESDSTQMRVPFRIAYASPRLLAC